MCSALSKRVLTPLEPRTAAVRILVRVEDEGAYATELLQALSRDISLPPEQYPMVQQWVKGVLENRIAIDQILGTRLKGKGLGGLPLEVRAVLRIGVYQISFLERAPVPLVINESVSEARRLGFSGLTKLVNAVLRGIDRDGVRRTDTLAPSGTSISEVAILTSHPEWLVQRWSDLFGIETATALCRASNAVSRLCFRINALKVTAIELQRELESEGVLTTPGHYSNACLYVDELPRGKRIQELRAFGDGLFFVQDESSMLVTELIDVSKLNTVIDLCSAPGGKTCSMAIDMKNSGKLYACDPDGGRLNRVRENCARLGITNVEFVEADGRLLESEPADLVVVDAPCTGLGTIGRRADLRWNKSPEAFAPVINLQGELLSKLPKLVRPNGHAIYSTCSVDRYENEGTVQDFLDSNSSFSVVSVKGKVPDAVATDTGFLRTWPHLHGVSGAFGALLKFE